MEVFISSSFLSFQDTVAHYSMVKHRQNSTKENSSLANLFYILHISMNLEAQLLDPFGTMSSVGQDKKQPFSPGQHLIVAAYHVYYPSVAG